MNASVHRQWSTSTLLSIMDPKISRTCGCLPVTV